MKISKRTLAIINKHSDINSDEYCPQICTVADILNRSGVILGESGHYEINNGDDFVIPCILSDGKQEFVSGTVSGNYQTRIVRGLASKYPDVISGAFTHGLNGVAIYNINTLIRKIISGQSQ